MTFGSLFAGVGGFDLGFERAGLRCAWQVEIDEYCRRILDKHWPNVPRHADIKTFPPPGDWDVDIICGGFPCQDISNAGKRAGINGERSGLWSEMLRVIRVVRPRFVVVENVAALLVRGLDTVLADFSALGFDAEWHTFSAANFGSYQIRERVFVLAYPNSDRRSPIIAPYNQPFLSLEKTVAEWCGRKPELKRGSSGRVWPTVAPLFQRMADGFSRGLDEPRLATIGNAVVPQISEWIGRRIIETSNQPTG